MINFFEPFPTSVEVNGQELEVDMDFSNIFRIESIRRSEDLLTFEKIKLMFESLFNIECKIPLDEAYEIFEKVYTKLIGGAREGDIKRDLKGNPMPVVNKGNKYFDLIQDAEYIYSSFLYDYGIDLYDQVGKMHWYKFNALLSGLSEDSKLMKVIGYRSEPIPTGKGSQKQAKLVRERKKKYALKGSEIDGE